MSHVSNLFLLIKFTPTVIIQIFFFFFWKTVITHIMHRYNKWLNRQIHSAIKIIHVNTIHIPVFPHSLFMFQISMQYVLCLVIKPSVSRYNYLIRIFRSKHDYIMIINKIKSVIENHLLCSCFFMQTCQWGWLNIRKVWPWLQPLMIFGTVQNKQADHFNWKWHVWVVYCYKIIK